MIPILYLVMLVAWVLLIAGFVAKDYWILCFASLLLMAIGLVITIYGITDIENLVTLTLGAIHIGVGGYVIVRGGIEVIKETNL